MIEKKEGLSELIQRGGIYKDIKGGNSREVLTALTEALPPIFSIPPEMILDAVMEREALMSTGIGRGIALPHPRNPLVQSEREQFTALAFLEEPVDWYSLDGQRVDTLFLIISASAKQHLRTLSEITFFCRQDVFYQILRERSSQEDLLGFIRDAEKNWKRHQPDIRLPR